MCFSLVFLGLGLYKPFMTFKIEVDMSGAGFFGNLFGGSIAKEMNKTVTYNIPQAMKRLYNDGHRYVAVLIGLFAIIIPITKTVLTGIYLFNKKHWLYRLLSYIGKFAMADVFCVGIVIAFMYTNFDKTLTTHINVGFNYFLIYVILNIVATMFLESPEKKLA